MKEAFKVLKSGNFALVKGKINKSGIISRMQSEDPELVMPPPESELSVSPAEIAMLAKWIKQGAEFKEHWSFLPIKNQTVPEINEAWKQVNPIDNFIQETLKRNGLSPSEETDKERLIKRVTMDLTGLPPSLSEIDQFLDDQTENAYELLVDRLLESDAYAERLTQEWMDVARYSDSHGVSFDGYRTSWPYRDWLIKAFKSNMGYDEFIAHQLAGDLIPNSDQQSKIATSFLRMNPLEASGGSIPEEFRLEYVNERAGLTGTAILGLTVECAKCHDHKFDPITQKEFFQISAFYNTTVEYGLAPVDSDRPPTIMMIDDKKRNKIDSMYQQIAEQESKLESILADPPSSYLADLPSKIPADHVGYYPLNQIKHYSKEIKSKKKEKPKKKEFLEMQMLDGNKLAEANLKVTLAEGKNGKGAYFNEEYDFLKLQKMGEFEHTDPFSISTWINTEKDAIGSSQTIIGNVGRVFAYHRGWEMALDSFNHVRVRFIHRLPDDVLSLRTQKPVTANVWHQIGFTYDGSKSNKGIKIFVDGISQEIEGEIDNLQRSMLPIDEFTMKPDTIPLVVGKSNRLWMEDLGLFTGTIDEIKIYDCELSHWDGLIFYRKKGPMFFEFGPLFDPLCKHGNFCRRYT